MYLYKLQRRCPKSTASFYLSASYVWSGGLNNVGQVVLLKMQLLTLSCSLVAKGDAVWYQEFVGVILGLGLHGCMSRTSSYH